MLRRGLELGVSDNNCVEREQSSIKTIFFPAEIRLETPSFWNLETHLEVFLFSALFRERRILYFGVWLRVLAFKNTIQVHRARARPTDDD